MLTIEEIDGILQSIEAAEIDENWDAVSSLLPKAQVVLLADIDKRLEKLTRAVTAILQVGQ